MLTIERDGTGIERSGTGIKRSGTGIERSGTGIERDGTGIKRSGTGIARQLFTSLLVLMCVSGYVSASERSFNVIKNNEAISITFESGYTSIIGVASVKDSYAIIPLFERPDNNGVVDLVGSGTGSSTDLVGSGTGQSTDLVGSGTGQSTDLVGSGTGQSTDLVGSGTGQSTDLVGSGTGQSTDLVGSGTGQSTDLVGSGTGQESASTIWGYAEISLNRNTADVLVFQADGNGGMQEISALEIPVNHL